MPLDSGDGEATNFAGNEMKDRIMKETSQTTLIKNCFVVYKFLVFRQELIKYFNCRVEVLNYAARD